MRNNVKWQKREMKETPNALKLADYGPSSSSYLQLWVCLCDKDYRGAIDILQAILPKRKPQNGMQMRRRIGKCLLTVSSWRTTLGDYARFGQCIGDEVEMVRGIL